MQRGRGCLAQPRPPSMNSAEGGPGPKGQSHGYHAERPRVASQSVRPPCGLPQGSPRPSRPPLCLSALSLAAPACLPAHLLQTVPVACSIVRVPCPSPPPQPPALAPLSRRRRRRRHHQCRRCHHHSFRPTRRCLRRFEMTRKIRVAGSQVRGIGEGREKGVSSTACSRRGDMIAGHTLDPFQQGAAEPGRVRDVIQL